METTEGNALIAIFMGGFKETVVINNIKQVPQFWQHDSTNSPLQGCRHTDGTLKYHTSWDWIMPSWSKLISILLVKCPDKAHYLSNKMLNSVNDNNIHNAFTIVIEGINNLNGNG